MARRPEGWHEQASSDRSFAQGAAWQSRRRQGGGPGWRVYYAQRGAVLIVMLGGGEKATQSADICRAVQLAANIEE